MSSGLFLRVLGPLRLERGGLPVDVGGARQREVLARLCVAQGHPVTVEALLSDVWGPAIGTTAASSLHVSISKLRRAIDPQRQARQTSPLVSTSGGYALHVDTDASAVENLVRRASNLIASDDLSAARSEVVRARDLWSGDPYDGVGEHSWLVLERRRCEELGLFARQLYAETSLRLGIDAAGVVLDLTDPVRRHPEQERLSVLLAVALYREQRQDDALTVLRSSRDHLRDHSGLDPGPDLVNVERLILAQEPDCFTSPARSSVPPASVHSMDLTFARGDYPLVGRTRTRAVLDAATEAAESGHPTTALLVGEAGIGKTRLTRAVTENLVARGWRAVWTQSTEDDGAPALWPWISVVRQLDPTMSLPAELGAFSEDAAIGPGQASAADRWRLTRHVGVRLREATRETPLAVVLDDLHWSDAASQALLAELIAQLETGCRLLLLVTTRSEGPPPLEVTFARLARLGVLRLEINGLTVADVQALAASAGLEVDAGLLHGRTGGNPFLLKEILAFAAETGSSPLDVVPPSVAGMMELARTDARTRANGIGDGIGDGVHRIREPTELIVGRKEVFATIEDVLTAADRGRGRAVLIEGPAGIGKSTVLRAATSRKRQRDVTTVRGSGVAGGASGPPYWPWVQILRQLKREFPGLVERAGSPVLASIDPALVPDATQATHLEQDAALSRTRLYRAVIDLLIGARQEGLLVVVIDDAHWLDEASAHLLAVAVPELADEGVAFIIGFRSEDNSVTDEALATLGGLRRDLVVRVRLTGLDLPGVEQVVRSLHGREPHPGVTAAITKRTAGNPLFVRELVQLLMSEDRLDPAGVYQALPAEVRDVLRRRLERLPETAVDVLMVTALVGRPVDMPLVVRITGLADEDVLFAFESAAVVGLVVSDEERPDLFTLSHDLVRQTLVELASTARRTRLHARIAEEIQVDAAPMPEHVVEVAHHLRLAAPLIGPAPAIPFLIAAADDALARMAVEQAEEILTDTLALASGLGPEERTTVERQARGRLAVLRVFSEGPAVAEASGLLTPPAPDAQLRLDPADPAEWWAAMTVAGALGEYERMVRDAQAALRPELTPAVALMVRMELGLGLFQLGRFHDAATHLRVARALLADGAAAQFVGLSVSADAVLNLQALMAHFQGEEAEADAILVESTANTEGSLTRLVVVTFVKAWLSASRGDASACADHARECSRMGAQLAYPAYISMGRVLSGWAAAMLGDRSGLEAADDAYADYVSDGTRLNTTLFSVLRAEAYARHGRPEEARRLVEDARRITTDIGERSLGPRLRALADALAAVEALPPDVEPTEPRRLSSTDY